jgi:microcystin-dependent protein
MSEPFLSEIRLVSFNFPPKGWAECNGQFLPINQNQALFSLLGTTYGGNGQTTFQLPDLRGRCAIHMGNGHTLGERAGEVSHTVTIQELPTHLHSATVSKTTATTDVPDATVIPATATLDLYHSPTSLGAMEPGIVGNSGGSQPHENMQPYTVVNFIIALQGIFPSQN